MTRLPNFHLILSDGCSIPLPPNNVKLAYSNHLIEHLHPDDTIKQLENIFQAMVPSGIYICITPNRLSGPHDISRCFDQVATGFHLKEYSVLELSSLFRKVGFSQVRIYIGVKGKYVGLPAFPVELCETLLDMLPYALRKIIMRIHSFRLLNEIRLIGIK